MRVNVPSHNTYVTFPDATPHDVIERVLREGFGTKKEPEPVKSPEAPIEAPNSPVVEPGAKVDTEALTIPDDLQDLNGNKDRASSSNGQDLIDETMAEKEGYISQIEEA